MKKTAFITGITGQDGAYLAEILLKKKFVVHGLIRRSSLIKTDRIDHIYNNKKFKNKFFLHYGDMTDGSSLLSIIKKIQPNIIYNLAAQSHVKVSFETPEYTANADALGTLRLLEAIRILNLEKKTKFYQASTSEMYGNHGNKILNEKSFLKPVSPYGTAKLYSYWITKNYRDAFKIHASNGILFNHESPLRGETFVTRKITIAISQIYFNKLKYFTVGNLDAKRDWGHAKDYAEGMYLISTYKNAEDFVLATGKSYSVRFFIEKCFKHININIIWKGKGIKEVGLDKKTNKVLVKVNKNFFRPNELHHLKGDASKARKLLKWKSSYTIEQLIKEMMMEELKKLGLNN
jgi:GDPmannose 4,6-dehydratase